MKNVIIGVLITIILGMFLTTLVGYVFYKKSFEKESNGLIVKDRTNFIEEENETKQIGGEKDEFGCLIGAGYSWCEEKQKCIREWEEECQESARSGITRALAEKYEKNISEVDVSITKEEDGYASGGVVFAPGGTGNGGMYLAVKKNNEWQIVFDGNGAADCQMLESEYDFPKEMLIGICY